MKRILTSLIAILVAAAFVVFNPLAAHATVKWTCKSGAYILRSSSQVLSQTSHIHNALRLSWQSDGNLVVYRLNQPNLVNGKWVPKWASNTSGQGTALHLGLDGSVKIPTKAGGPKLVTRAKGYSCTNLAKARWEYGLHFQGGDRLVLAVRDLGAADKSWKHHTIARIGY